MQKIGPVGKGWFCETGLFCYDICMKTSNILFSLVATILMSTTLVQSAVAATDYEEVSYDDLVNQLHEKKNSYRFEGNDPFQQNKIHVGFGLLTSMTNTEYDGGKSMKYQNGFQLSLGIDLFSPIWAAEGNLRNFGQAHSGTETRSLREFALKLMHRDRFNGARDSLNGGGSLGYRAGFGVGNRYLRISDDINGLVVNDNTPAMVFFGGLDAYASKNFSIGIETDYHASLVGNTADKGALDFTFRLDTYF